jgi:hypothetical protein
LCRQHVENDKKQREIQKKEGTRRKMNHQRIQIPRKKEKASFC